MNSIKGRFKVNGVEIELEAASTGDMAHVISELTTNAVKRQQVARDIKTDVTSGRRKVAGKKWVYHTWTTNDIVAVGRLAREYGRNGRGFANMVFNYLRVNGETKGRSLKSTSVMAGQVHRFIHMGVTRDMATRVVAILRENGYAPGNVGNRISSGRDLIEA